MKRVFLIFFSLFVTLSQNSLAKQPLIAASINPIYQIVLAITQEKSNISLIINPKFSEHDYHLKNSDLRKVKNADLVFYIGDNLEHNVAKLVKNYKKQKQSYKLIEIDGIKLLPSRSNKNNYDQHIWLDPDNVLKIAEFVTKKISEFDTENTEKYKSNLESFKKEVVTRKDEITKILQNLNQANYVFYHDGYQYFENYFSLKPSMIISSDHDHEITLKSMKELNLLVKEKNVKCIFGDVQDEKDSARKLAKKYKIKFFTLDLMGLKDNKSNGYLVLLDNMTESLESCH
ncbi:MAG: zinc ABC transporter substrate-binding protein [Pelagibacterales bacterium]|nr:zinc ABC transporter substrate-binding protein [Pelagibacterales bacterium]